MAKKVREPIQVYLDREDRALLDRLAQERGISRAEILRRGLKSLAAQQSTSGSPMLDFLRSIAGDDWPADMAERHDHYLAEIYADNHES